MYIHMCLSQVSSPCDLEMMDSDTSSVMAGWSFSMATPSCPWVDAGKGTVAANSSVSTTDESSNLSSEVVSDLVDESSPVKDIADVKVGKTCSKIRKKTTIMNSKVWCACSVYVVFVCVCMIVCMYIMFSVYCFVYVNVINSGWYLDNNCINA